MTTVSVGKANLKSRAWQQEIYCYQLQFCLVVQHNYTTIARLCEILKLKIFSEKTFHNIQDEYLFPAIDEYWKQEQTSVFESLKGKPLWLSGDGRCDSPGHNAKYGTYTMLEQKTEKVINFKRSLSK